MRKTRIATFATACLAATVISSCVMDQAPQFYKSGGFRNSEKWGKVITKDTLLRNFSRISTLTNADIVYTQGKEYSVSIKGNENAISMYDIETDSAGTLTVRSSSKARTNVSIPNIVLNVTAPDIKEFLVGGSGDIVAHAPIQSGTVRITNYGSGDITFHEYSTGNIEINVDGSGDVKIRHLTAEQNLQATTSGSGDIDLVWTRTPEARLLTNGSGDIDGNLEADNIEAESTGSGDIDIEVNCTTLQIASRGSGEVEVEGTAQTLIRDKAALGLVTTKNLHAKQMK